MKINKVNGSDYKNSLVTICYLQVGEWDHPTKEMQILFFSLKPTRSSRVQVILYRAIFSHDYIIYMD